MFRARQLKERWERVSTVVGVCQNNEVAIVFLTY